MFHGTWTDCQRGFHLSYLGDGSYILIEAPRPQGGAPRHCTISFILCPLSPPIPQGAGRGMFQPITIRRKLSYRSHHFCFLSMADPVFRRHPVIGVYKFYENWSTETFKRKSQRVGCLFRLQILSVVRIFAFMITTRNAQSQVPYRCASSR